MRLTLYLALSALLLLTGCNKPAAPIPQPAQPDPKIAQLEAQIKELQGRLDQSGEPVNLISPHYPPAVAGDEGWVYHKSLTGDLNGDGKDEKVSMTTNAAWLPDRQIFAWDDGHPWHIYVEAEDGSRTYLFSSWVQMDRPELVLDRTSPGLFMIFNRPGSLTVYRATYQGPGEAEVRLSFSIPMSNFATWNDPTLFVREP